MIDLEKLKAIYHIGKGLQMEDLNTIFEFTKRTSFAPSEYLIEEGSLKKEVFYIKKGLVRSFAINEKGDEITIGLQYEHHALASPDTILFHQASRFYYQAIEPTETLSMNYDVLQSIISKNIKLEQTRKYILQRMLKEAQDRIESFVLYSPEERYIRYMQSNPDIANRVPDKYIANILGITPVSLSRIRKRIASKKNRLH